jgi:ParB-like chromosome segregation protein Spo0J
MMPSGSADTVHEPRKRGSQLGWHQERLQPLRWQARSWRTEDRSGPAEAGVTDRLRTVSTWNYRAESAKSWQTRCVGHGPGSSRSCGGCCGKSALWCNPRWLELARDRDLSRTGFRPDAASIWLDFVDFVADGHGPLSEGEGDCGCFSPVTAQTQPDRHVTITDLGERLARLRLCDPAAVETVRGSLTRHGQLTAMVVFEERDGLEVIDGFKRLQAARQLGWSELRVRQVTIDAASATVQIAALHAGRGLTEIEEAWIVRSLYRDCGMSQPTIAERLGRHKSWVYRRLLLVEALDQEVGARMRLGLIAPRAAVALAGLPRGNQTAACDVVIQRGLTVRQTELFVGQLLGCETNAARDSLLSRWASGESVPSKPGPAPTRVIRSEADWLASDLATLHRVAARVQARLMARPLLAFGPSVAELLAESLTTLEPVLTGLIRTIGKLTIPPTHAGLGCKESAA